MITRRNSLTGAIALAFSATSVGLAYAQAYPQKPIKLILPYTAGSPNDVICRIVASILSLRLGQPVVIDNRPGGGTTIGLKAVMTAEPDGYTLLFSNTPTHVIAHFGKGLVYDPIKDFVPIVTVGSTSLVLVVPSTIAANSLQEFINYAKENPGLLNFGFGQGTLPHLVGEAFKLDTGTQIADVPYRGGAQAITDMLGGRIHMNFGTGVTLVPLIRQGKIKALAVTGPARNPELPEVRTMTECGLPNLTSVSYYGLFGPGGTPPEVVAKLNSEFNESMKSSEVRGILVKAGFEPTGGSPQDFAALIVEQLQRWAPIVKATGFQMN